MSQKEFLQVPLQAALEIYNNQLVPRLTTRNKVIAITSAISLSLIFYIRQKVFKPPKIFRHLPYDSAFNVIKAAIQGECLSDYMDRETLSLLYSENSKGLCMVIYILKLSLSLFVTIKLTFLMATRDLGFLDGKCGLETQKMQSVFY
jgi:hypothetical protein